MGNQSGSIEESNAGADKGELREVALFLHSVHNVQHSCTESYYGMASCCGPRDAPHTDVPVTSERSAVLHASIDSVISVRIFLHERGTPSASDRMVGQLMLPVREVVGLCGPGIYQTWFLLESPSQNASPPSRLRAAERLRRAMHCVSQDVQAPRICLTLLEANTDSQQWTRDEAAAIKYYDTVLVSHQQHLHATRKYLDVVERAEAPNEPGRRQQSSSARAEAPSAPAASLRRASEAGRNIEEEEANQLRVELDQITEEANRRIEKGNDAILKLKAQLKELRDVEAPRLMQENADAERQLEVARRQNEQLKRRIERQDCPELDEEVTGMQQEVLVLSKQKAALMAMVQDIYGVPKEDLQESSVQEAAARALADIRGLGQAAEQPKAVDTPNFFAEDGGDEHEGNLLPLDPHEFLGEEIQLRPL
mmetsp:Transcript_2603/g.6069  ORF Transcript_2603/g.6069 Transcript_2603/m.6069 type:complete len:424 (+) Transcript_2603:111-1382(+)